MLAFDSEKAVALLGVDMLKQLRPMEKGRSDHA
jgi:hypothetical protein